MVIKKILLIFILLFTTGILQGQDFSNKGREFWLAFPPHQPSNGGPQNNPTPALANLSVYISSDKDSRGKIYINGIAVESFFIEANVTREYILDRNKTYISDDEAANSGNLNKTVLNKGIQVIVDEGYPPIVVYSHFYAQARSAASIILPSNVLQRKYMVMTYKQNNLSDQFDEFARSQFTVIATENNTRLNIKLKRNGVLSSTFSIDLLKKGEIYQFQDLYDLTGTEIESISIGTSTSCNKIAVFSGSSANFINWTSSTTMNTSDPLFQQLYPENSWGKNYFITDFRGKDRLIFRILAKDDNTEIKYRDKTVKLNRGQFFESNSGIDQPPFLIQSNRPISVAQFALSQNQDKGSGDPEMIILNSIEQSIDNVTVFLSSKENITDQNINVIIKDEGVSDFTINGVTYSNEFIKIIGTGFSYLKKQFNISSGNTFLSLNMKSSFGFNAFCYGFGSPESYGYSAGTNVKDLYQTVSINNKEAIIPYTRTCLNTAFNFSVTLPYKPTILKWNFNNTGQLFLSDGTVVNEITKSNGGLELTPDDQFPSANDPTVMLYTYKLTEAFVIKIKKDLPYKITTINPTPDGCSGEQIIENIVEVKDPPKTTLTIESGGCINSEIIFKNSIILDEGIKENFYRWYIDDQLVSDATAIMKKSFSIEGARKVSVELITDIGCVSPKDTKQFTLSQKPVLLFEEDQVRCIGKEFIVTNKSTLNGIGQIVEGTWKVYDKYLPSETQFSNLKFKTFNSTVVLKYLAKTNTGCTDSTVEKTIKINPNPVLDVILPEFCLTDGVANFKANSTIDASDNVSQINWTFGDTKDPSNNFAQGLNVNHLFSEVGPYNMNIKAISSNNCITSKDTLFIVNGSDPNANFKFLNTAFCSNKDIILQNTSIVKPGNITKVELSWYLDDGTFINQIDERPDTNNTYKRLFADFTQEKKILRAKLVAYSGSTCKGEYEIVSTPIYGSAKVAIGKLPDQCTGYPSIILPEPIITQVQNTTGIGNYFGSQVSTADITGKFKYTPPKTGASSIVFYQYETKNGCVTIDTSFIKLNPTPIINAGSDLSLLADSVIKINATASNGVNMRYQWSPTLYLNNPNILQPEIQRPQSDITYILTATGLGNCISKDSILLTALNYLKPPNTLVPGRPPYDKWVIDNIQKYKGCVLKIFDVNGRIIKTYDNGYDNNKPWNGTNEKDQFVPAGTYYYILDPKNGRKVQNGYVTIHR